MWLQQLVLRVILSRFLLWESSVRFLALSLQCFDDRDECMIENDGTTINYPMILFLPLHSLWFVFFYSPALIHGLSFRFWFLFVLCIIGFLQNENSV